MNYVAESPTIVATEVRALFNHVVSNFDRDQLGYN
jgi:hypothetical protein